MAIPIEVLKKVTVVYTHKSCPDGMASAMILKDAFRMLGTNPRIEFLAHNTPEHKAAGVVEFKPEGSGDWSLFCDIAPPLESLGNVRAAGAIVLDHHKGAEEIVRSFGELGVFADEKLEPGVSGAVLAFRQVWLPCRTLIEPRPLYDVDLVKDFAECVGARDTWQTQDTARFRRGQWISKFLMSKPKEFFLDQVIPYGQRGEAPNVRPHLPYLTEEEVHAGAALFEAHEEAVRQAVDQCVHLDVGTVRLIVFQEQASGFRLCSDVAESLRQKWRGGDPWAVIAGFSYVVQKPGESPVLLYSLRGLNGFDVAAFAKANGGGGHTAAAGFSVQLVARDMNTAVAWGGGDPYEEIKRRLLHFLTAR